MAYIYIFSDDYSFDGILTLEYLFSFGRGIGWYSFEAYRYVKVVVKDRPAIIITCLMVNQVEKTLGEALGMKPEKRPALIALIINLL